MRRIVRQEEPPEMNKAGDVRGERKLVYGMRLPVDFSTDITLVFQKQNFIINTS
jgi:hypothetical protein